MSTVRNLETRLMKILHTLFSLSAVSKDKAVSLEYLSGLTGLLEDDLKQILNELRTLGYVSIEKEKVYLTNNGIFKLSSIFC